MSIPKTVSAMHKGDRKQRKKEFMEMPFRKFTASFTPDQLKVLTAAFWEAKEELTKAGVEISESDLAKRILDQAADGIFHIGELKRAALDGLVRQPRLSSTVD